MTLDFLQTYNKLNQNFLKNLKIIIVAINCLILVFVKIL